LKRSISVQIAAFIAIRTTINTMVRMVYPFLLVFGRGLGVDLGMLSLAITIRQASGIIGPFLASVGDSRGRKWGMIFGVSLFVMGAGVLVVWPTYPAFVLALLLSIMANFVFIPSMQAYLGDHVPYERRGMALGLVEFGWSLSFIIGVPLVGLAIARGGWQAPFPWLVGLGLISVGLLAVLLPKDVPSTTEKPGLLRNFRAVFTHSSALAALLFALSVSASNELVNLTFGVWLEDAFKVKIAALAAASAVIGFAELSGEAGSSLLVDRLGKHRSVTAGLLLNALAALALPFLGSSLAGALVGLFLLYLTFEFTLVASIPLASEVLPGARATLMAIYIACMALGRAISDALAPLIYTAGTHINLPYGLSGILGVVLTALFANLVALLAVRRIHIQSEIAN
jgi:MFS transporter, DHA1 family, inner membrane transport protein